MYHLLKSFFIMIFKGCNSYLHSTNIYSHSTNILFTFKELLYSHSIQFYANIFY